MPKLPRFIQFVRFASDEALEYDADAEKDEQDIDDEEDEDDDDDDELDALKDIRKSIQSNASTVDISASATASPQSVIIPSAAIEIDSLYQHASLPLDGGKRRNHKFCNNKGHEQTAFVKPGNSLPRRTTCKYIPKSKQKPRNDACNEIKGTILKSNECLEPVKFEEKPEKDMGGGGNKKIRERIFRNLIKKQPLSNSLTIRRCSLKSHVSSDNDDLVYDC